MRKDKQASEDAREISRLQEEGYERMETIIDKAYSQMGALTQNLKTKEGKTEMLRYHAYAMGLIAEFMDSAVPQAEAMVDTMVETTGVNEETARVLRGVWLAKIIMGTREALNEHYK